MSYMIKAALSSAQRPEYGQVTVPFPIASNEYGHTLEMLDGLGAGDVLAQDCRVEELDSFYSVLKRLEGSAANVDELDYLAKRLDSFDDGEAAQFQAMAHKLDVTGIKDFINLTFCCQQATVITDFANLERAGKQHLLNINNGGMMTEEYAQADGRAVAEALIRSGEGVVTPYGVAYDNGMQLEPLYDGRHFPGYLHELPVLALEVPSIRNGVAGTLCLPAPDRQLQRLRLRAETGSPDTWMHIIMDELPEKVSDALNLERLSDGDLPGLNRLCRAVQSMKAPDREKLNAAVLLTETSGIVSLCQLAENLEQFDFVPGVHTPEEYGRYMIQESGHFAYDENLEGFYNYRQYGEQRVREEGGQFNERGYVVYCGTVPLEELMRAGPAEQYRQEQGMDQSW